MTSEQQKIADEALEEIKGQILSEIGVLTSGSCINTKYESGELAGLNMALDIVKDAEFAIERGSW